jgi:hypothetical protein
VFNPSTIQLDSYYVDAGDALADGMSLGNKIVSLLGSRRLSTQELADATGATSETVTSAIRRLGSAVIKVTEGVPGRGGAPATWGLRT